MANTIIILPITWCQTIIYNRVEVKFDNTFQNIEFNDVLKILYGGCVTLQFITWNCVEY
jgi:hypothetical protein